MPTTNAAARVQFERDLYLELLHLGSQRELAPFLERALEAVTRLAGAERGFLEVRCADEPARSFVRTRGFGAAEAEKTAIDTIRGELSRGIIAEALRKNQTISTASASEDPRFAGQKSVQLGQIQAVLCAPIGSPTPTGVIYLAGRKEAGPFPKSDQQAVELFARHLAPLATRLLEDTLDAATTDPTAAYRQKLDVANLVGRSAALADVLRQVGIAAPVPVAVLITGESGTGKTAVARALHQSSPRRGHPFVDLNCAAIPESLFESELFGAAKGAHSTATQATKGKIEAAEGGTLFLDEVGEMPLTMQGKLLTFLQDKRYYPLGSAEPRTADVRVVAATNADLRALVSDKRFREDLYYRLDVLSIRVPALRERKEDVVPLAESTLMRVADQSGPTWMFSNAARSALREAEWPGNVRELENVVQRGWAIALSEQRTVIEAGDLFPDSPADSGALSYQDATRQFQSRFLQDALTNNQFNVSRTARELDMSRSHLNELIKAFGLQKPAGAGR